MTYKITRADEDRHNIHGIIQFLEMLLNHDNQLSN
jgi:hypothetical protein